MALQTYVYHTNMMDYCPKDFGQQNIGRLAAFHSKPVIKFIGNSCEPPYPPQFSTARVLCYDLKNNLLSDTPRDECIIP